jgi:catechol 2,3-dioxygenase-like lactoylglutathione lyase family enzyme
LIPKQGGSSVLETIDHLVLTVSSIEASLKFYTRCLGMTEVTFGSGRKALAFGRHKINLHQRGHEFLPNATHAMPGSADLCFLASVPLEQAMLRLRENGVAIEEGPVERTGAMGRIRSVYVRDPDGNLLEISEYVERIRPNRESGGEIG